MVAHIQFCVLHFDSKCCRKCFNARCRRVFTVLKGRARVAAISSSCISSSKRKVNTSRKIRGSSATASAKRPARSWAGAGKKFCARITRGQWVVQTLRAVAPQVVDCQVAGHGEQPSLKTELRVVTADTLHDSQPSLLKQILGRGRFPHQAQKITVKAVLVTLHESHHGIDITTAQPRQ